MRATRSRHVNAAIATLVVALLGSACGGAGAPSSSAPPSIQPTASPAPTATPVPEPDAATVLASLRDPTLEIEFGVGGVLVVEADKLDVTGLYRSTQDGAYWQISAPGDKPVELELRELRGSRYVRREFEVPWFEETERYAGIDVMRALAKVARLEPAGTETRAEQLTWQFKADEISDIYVPGITTDATDMTAGALVATDRAGAIVQIEIGLSWSAAGADTTAPRRFMELVLTSTGRAGARAPDVEPIWERFASTRLGYSIGVPPGATTVEGVGKGADGFLFGQGEFLGVVAEPQPAGVTIDGYIEAFLKALKADGRTPSGSGSIGIGDCMYPTYGFNYPGSDGKDFVWRFALVVIDGVGYQLVGAAKPENEQVLDDLMPTWVCTFHVT